MRHAFEEIPHRFAHQRDSRGAADQHGFVNLFGRQFCVGQRHPRRRHRPRHNRRDQFLEIRTGHNPPEHALRSQRILDQRLIRSGQFVLRANHTLTQRLHVFPTMVKLHSVGGENFSPGQSQQRIVDVIAAQMRIAIRRQHLVNIAFHRAD